MPEKHQTACPMDCPDTCSLEVEVDQGRIQAIRGSHGNPVTQGFICMKISRFARRLYSPDRILHPMRRTGEKGSGQFERISWPEAMETICGQFTEIRNTWGGEAILPYSYGGSNGYLAQDTCDLALWAKLGASRLARTVCAAPTTEAAVGMYGKMPGVAFEDYEHARLIVIWGANPRVSHIHLMPYLKKARKAGARVVVVDPKLNFSRNEFDLHLPVYPGTDVVVALALVNLWQERGLLDREFIAKHTTGVDRLLLAAAEYPVDRAARIARVDAEAIEMLANWYADCNPAVIRIGWGLERNRNGGQSAAAILALPALMGKFGVRGGGYTLSNSGAVRLDPEAVIGRFPWNTREINMNRLGNVLLNQDSPPVKALFVYNCNPVATVPDQNAILSGLMRDDLFTVVSEQVMTDTALFADILLPAVTFLEQHELKAAYGAYTVQKLTPVVPAMGEAKPNEEMFAMLGRQMGYSEPVFRLETEEYLARVTAAVTPVFGKLRESADGLSFCYDFPEATPVQFDTVFPLTPDRKINCAPTQLGKQPYRYIPESKQLYPLALITPASSRMTSSTMGEFNFPELYIEIHPEDAQGRSLSHGDLAKIFNDFGEVKAQVRISPAIRQGVVQMPKGAWRKSSANGSTSTALCPATISEVGGGACFNDARVEVEALSEISAK